MEIEILKKREQTKSVDKTSCRMRRLLFTGLLLLGSLVGFANTIEVRVMPPHVGCDHVDIYCIEFREVDMYGTPLDADWVCFQIYASELEGSDGYTSFFITGLAENSYYEIRVHGKNHDGYWGGYGSSVIVTMPEGNGTTVTYIVCKECFKAGGEEHDDAAMEDDTYALLPPFDRFFSRPKMWWAETSLA